MSGSSCKYKGGWRKETSKKQRYPSLSWACYLSCFPNNFSVSLKSFHLLSKGKTCTEILVKHMGSSSSHLGSHTSRPRHNRTRLRLSSFICGGSTSHAATQVHIIRLSWSVTRISIIKTLTTKEKKPFAYSINLQFWVGRSFGA